MEDLFGTNFEEREGFDIVNRLSFKRYLDRLLRLRNDPQLRRLLLSCYWTASESSGSS